MGFLWGAVINIHMWFCGGILWSVGVCSGRPKTQKVSKIKWCAAGFTGLWGRLGGLKEGVHAYNKSQSR